MTSVKKTKQCAVLAACGFLIGPLMGKFSGGQSLEKHVSFLRLLLVRFCFRLIEVTVSGPSNRLSERGCR